MLFRSIEATDIDKKVSAKKAASKKPMAKKVVAKKVAAKKPAPKKAASKVLNTTKAVSKTVTKAPAKTKKA